MIEEKSAQYDMLYRFFDGAALPHSGVEVLNHVKKPLQDGRSGIFSHLKYQIKEDTEKWRKIFLNKNEIKEIYVKKLKI